MIKIGDKSIKSLFFNNKPFNKAYCGDKLMFKKTTTKPYFCEVEYLEATGTQYIDTGYIANQDTRIVTKHYYTKSPKNNGFIYGAGVSATSRAFEMYTWTSHWNSPYNVANLILTPPSEDYFTNGIITIDKNKNEVTITYADGETQRNYTEYGVFTTPYTLVLFAINRSASAPTYKADCLRLYSCKIWDNDTLVRDYIPVLDFDMQPCMYDKVSGQFFYNQGTGEFLYGRQIHEVEYLESTGEQYIDTGYNICTETDEVELDYQLLDTTIYKWLFGEHDNNARFGVGSGDGVNKRNLAYGATTTKLTETYLFDSKHSFKASKDGAFVDGVKFFDYKNFTSTSSIWLFNLNLSPYTYGTKTRIWKYRHERNGILIRDYIPAVDENGKSFMFDKVSHTIFDNKGTGEFSHPLIKLKYIESTGTQWIDTGVVLTNNHSVEIDYKITEVQQARKGLFGGLTSKATARYGSLLSPTTNYLEHGYGAGNIYYQTGLPDTKRHLFKQENNKVYIDNILIYTFNEATFTLDATAPLGNFNYTNYTPAKARYYSSRWWNGNVLIRDFIPVLDNNMKPCWYDNITGQFFYNKGSGEFLYKKGE